MGGISKNLDSSVRMLAVLLGWVLFTAASLHATDADTATINNLCRQAETLHSIDAQQAVSKAREALALAEKAGYKEGGIRARLALSTYYLSQGDYNQAIGNIERAKWQAEQLQNLSLLALALHREGNYHYRQANYARAINKYTEALDLREKIGETLAAEKTLNNIAELLADNYQPEQALGYFQQLRARQQTRGDSAALAVTLSNLASVYIKLGQHALAEHTAVHALELARTTGNVVVVWESLSNQGVIRQQQKQWNAALMNFTQAADIARGRSDDFMLAPTLNRIAEVQLALGLNREALATAQKSLSLSAKLNSLSLLRDTYKTMGAAQEKNLAYAEALQYSRLWQAANDSITGKDRLRIFADAELKFESQKKEGQIALLRKNDEMQQVYRNLLIVGYALLAIIFGLLIIRYRQRIQSEQQVRRKNEEVQIANAEITRQVRLLDAQAQELKQLGDEKDEIIGIAAHDIKNPVAAIRIFINLFKESAGRLSQAETLDYANKVQISADQIMDIVQNLLESNRLEQGKVGLIPEALDLVPMLESVAENYRTRAQTKHIGLKLTYEDPLPYVLADKMAVTQVLDNLVSNAVKFSPTGATVYVQAYEKGDAVRIEIKDEGPGILPKDMPRLFGKFARLSARPTGGESSTGLGLNIVKKLVEMMNGTVGCESEPGKGSTFYVTLAVSRVEDVEDEPEVALPEQGEHA